MVRFSIAALLCLAVSASAISDKICKNITIPVQISSRQGLFKPIPIESNFDTQAFAQAFTRAGRNYTTELLEDYQTVKGEFRVSAQYCQPKIGASAVVQVLTHGIGYDKVYVLSL